MGEMSFYAMRASLSNPAPHKPERTVVVTSDDHLTKIFKARDDFNLAFDKLVETVGLKFAKRIVKNKLEG